MRRALLLAVLLTGCVGYDSPLTGEKVTQADYDDAIELAGDVYNPCWRDEPRDFYDPRPGLRR